MEEENGYSYRIGNKIKKFRELKNLTQEHLAQEINMSVSGYSRIERDEVKVTIDKLEKISNVLGVKVEDLMRFDDSLVFNNYGNATEQSFSYNQINNDVSKIEALYQEQIKILKDEIKHLRDLVKKLSS